MAQPTNTFDSYDSIGTREDLQDKMGDWDYAVRSASIGSEIEMKKPVIPDDLEHL